VANIHTPSSQMLTDIDPSYPAVIMRLINTFNRSGYQGQLGEDAALLSKMYDNNTIDFKDNRVNNFVRMFEALAPSGTISMKDDDRSTPAAIVEPYYQSLNVDPALFGQQQ